MRIDIDDLSLDDSPIPSDFEDLQELFKDIASFAKANPDHKFICADDPGVGAKPRSPRIGWCAFLEGKSDEDEQFKRWTITVNNVRDSLSGPNGRILRSVLKDSEGRFRSIQWLVQYARIPDSI